MSTAVLDTNVLASGFVRSNPAAAPVRLIDAWRSRRFVLITSEHIVGELERVLERPYFRRRLTAERRAADIALLRTEGTLTPITAEVSGVATHPEDDRVLATAVSAQADYLVTGDRRLQELGSYRDVTILSPRAFLDVLARQAQP